MICLDGKVICKGFALGTAYVFRKNTAKHTKEHKPLSVTDELKRLELAVLKAKEELSLCIAESDSNTAKEIFEIHRMMLEDEDILSYLQDAVKNSGIAAQEAVKKAECYFSELFKSTQDDYMIARIDDIRDVCGRLSSFLQPEVLPKKLQKPAVLVADELLPGDLVEIGKENIIGIVTSSGTLYSHASILIREMGIPALICENIDEIKTGMEVLLDGECGTAYFEPDAKTIENFKNNKDFAAQKNKPLFFDKLPCKLYVNIGNAGELNGDLVNKCDGVGLFRTEYMYLGKAQLPDEEEQFKIYKEILEKANGKSVTVRTFDIGSDKSVETLPLKKEENPALGLRGLRVYSLYPEAFKSQVRALLRAAVYGNLRIMYPMVTSSAEISEIKKIVSNTAQELKQQGILYKIPPQGAMIETPAAALLSDEIAKTVDFFSVGTNDLTQYTLAIDRQSGELEPLDANGYKAVISLIKIATDNAHNNGIEIGICGELASVPEFTKKWIELGMDYLSVSPFAVNEFVLQKD